jgi:hypothetical protein
MTPRSRARTLAPLLLSLLAACSGDATSPETRPMGTYTLRTVAGRPLPWVQFTGEAGDSTIVLGSAYTFRGDSTFSIRYDYRYVRRDSTWTRTYEEEGNYRTVGNALQMSDYFWRDELYYAELSGRTLTAHGRYEDWVYKK